MLGFGCGKGPHSSSFSGRQNNRFHILSPICGINTAVARNCIADRFKWEYVWQVSPGCRGLGMAFDVLSFLAGITAGGLTGALAGTLYSLEKTADLQERVRHLARQIDTLGVNLSSPNGSKVPDSKTNEKELRRELDVIHEEIRRMYKRSSH